MGIHGSQYQGDALPNRKSVRCLIGFCKRPRASRSCRPRYPPPPPNAPSHLVLPSKTGAPERQTSSCAGRWQTTDARGGARVCMLDANDRPSALHTLPKNHTGRQPCCPHVRAKQRCTHHPTGDTTFTTFFHPITLHAHVARCGDVVGTGRTTPTCASCHVYW